MLQISANTLMVVIHLLTCGILTDCSVLVQIGLRANRSFNERDPERAGDMGSRKSRLYTTTVPGGFTAAEAIARAGRFIYDAILSRG